MKPILVSISAMSEAKTRSRHHHHHRSFSLPPTERRRKQWLHFAPVGAERRGGGDFSVLGPLAAFLLFRGLCQF